VQDYLERTSNHKREPFYIASDKTRGDAHIASSSEIKALASGFAIEFMRIYNTGIDLQRRGKEVQAQVST